jgi:hypothetical protein
LTRAALRLGVFACFVAALPCLVIGHDRALEALYKVAWSLAQRERRLGTKGR